MVLQGRRILPGFDARLPHAAFPGKLYGLHGLGDITPDSTGTSWMDNIGTWISQAQTAYNTQKLLDLNIERAQRGLAPITSNMVAPTVNFGLSPNTQQLVIYAGIGLLILLAVKKAGK